MEANPKLRMLYILKILYEYSDEEHSISTAKIIKMLSENYGITAHRVTVTKDIELLKEFGIDIETIHSTQNKYFIASRIFELAELKLLTDAILSSKVITEKKSKALSEKISGLASIHDSEKLKRSLYIDGQIKLTNEQVYYITDALNVAINSGKKVTFQYFEYDNRKNKIPKHDGRLYKFSPYTLVWNGDHYYVVGFEENHKDICTFRVDRIAGVPEITDERAVPLPEGIDLSSYLNTMLSMYNCQRYLVTMRCDKSMMNAVIDNFGINVKTQVLGEDEFKVEAEVATSPVFYRWVFGFGGKVKILSPKSVREEYAKMVREAMENLK